MENEHKPIVGYKIVKDEKGNDKWIPKFLVETPKEEINRLNNMFTEWKTTKQVKYDNNGMRIK